MEATAAHAVQYCFGNDGARGIASAEKEDVVGLIHRVAQQQVLRLAISARGPQIEASPLQQSSMRKPSKPVMRS